MGEDGTNDDLTARLCVGDECCDTLLLNGVLSDDWSSGDEEEWDEDWLGECAEKEFEVRHLFANILHFGVGEAFCDFFPSRLATRGS